MTDVVGQLADLTALRDRQSLDSALVSTLNDLLQPRSALIARLVSQGDQARWLICADIQEGALRPTQAHAWTDLDELPLAIDFPTRQQVLATHQPRLAGHEGGLNVFAIISPATATAVLELNTAQALADEQVRLINGVLRLYQNFQNLLDYGERDALTELLNRKTFDGAFLKATVAQAPHNGSGATDQCSADLAPPTVTRSGGRYWLAMLDIDHFKRVNDNFGHLIGDEVLLLLARLMRNTFRFDDQLYRFGGEEFVVLMRCESSTQATTALQRLRSATEQYRFPQVGQITISIGFTEVRPGDAPSNAIERADKAVYYVKEHGRNQVCGFEALLAGGQLTVEPDNVGDVELF
ncbi:MAG: GGDEF domain-containing protein [Rhodoferax sp.]|nr:GGDEF domain-containing protein [Rhodoferax sp.]OIP19765.1 MAG: GGDEF domain-containing protein [Comamonadaceae bacterium CG2_30_60_41]PIW07374.1 MAG: GGDEF domain-containing protein [Comamonadaceae bacterium CG17_big_fil_post_rev_8_21_14_2_50_60_13]PIY26345.1 MAG: GGDEF domain-containing protein [Comamonadaceae bacterium CG_4_10_14_3_um_filter_60_75]PJC12568.1 MAG: GGDEF domain-containing protein [Comamonadaceae bacterium CG_4_9_14_0_8_um_filter_60_18]